MSSDPTREQGIDFGDLDEDLQSMDYPTSAEEIRREFGDRELDLVSGSMTVDEALEGSGEQTFDSPDQVKEILKNMVGSDAVGREGYSDRGGTSQGSDTDESI